MPEPVPELSASKAADSAAFNHAGMQGMYAQQMPGMQQQQQQQQQSPQGPQAQGCQQQPAAQQMQYPGY